MKSKEELIPVTVKKWENYNLNKDTKKHSWFRFSNTFFDDEIIFGLPADTKTLFIYLLCATSKHTSMNLHISSSQVRAHLGFKKPYLFSVLSALKSVGLIDFGTPTDDTNGRYDTNVTNDYKGVETSSLPLIKKEIIPVKKPKIKKPVPVSGATWIAYSDAYERRYGIKPVRNANVSGKLVQFVARIGEQESPLVAEFYLTHNDPWYVKSMHPVGLLLQNCEKLRTEWATGRKMTTLESKSAETTDSFVEQMKRLTGNE